jgi:malonate transporter
MSAFEVLLPIFLLIALGFGMRKSGLIPADQWRGIELAAFWVFFPALVGDTLLQADLKSLPLTGITLTMFLTAITMAAIVLGIRHPLMRSFAIDGPAFTSIFQCSTRWNGFVALPIVGKLYGQPGIAIVAVGMAVLVPLINVMNITVLATYASATRPPARQIALTVLKNPFIWGTALGLSVNLSGIPVYEPLLKTLNMLGNVALGLGLVMVGAGLREDAALQPSPAMWAGTLIRLFITPLVMGGFALFFGLSGTALVTVIICAAVPTAMNGYVFARQMGGDAPLYAATVTVQTALSFVTIPAFIWLAGMVG